MLTQVHLIDVAAVIHARGNDVSKVGRDTLYAWLSLLITIVGSIRRPPGAKQNGSYCAKLRHTLFEAFNVLVVHGPPASFAKALIRFACLLGPDKGSVLGKAFKVLVQHFFHTLSAAHEYH